MDWFDLDDTQRAHVTDACRREHLDDSYGAFVVRHVDVADATWRWCCSSSCDPCVEQLGRAVDRARALLGVEPPGLPSP